jgi:excisionase family DNA binding protein
MSQLLTTREAALFLGCHSDTLRRWRVEGRGPAYARLNRLIRYPVEHLQRFIERRTKGEQS